LIFSGKFNGWFITGWFEFLPGDILKNEKS